MKRISLICLVLALGCGDDDVVTDAGPGTDVGPNADAGPDAGMTTPVYAFESQFEAAESSVSYSGQIFRHVLIDDLNTFVGGLGDAIDSGTAGLDTAAGIRASLDFYVRFDDAGLAESIRLTTTPAAMQMTYEDLSSAKDLVGKLAGQDGRDHRDFTMEFAGWGSALGESTPTSPIEYLDALLDEIARLGELRANGESPVGPGGEVLPPYLTADGLDLKQLLQKFLLSAVAFSQGADDYLDEGLDSPNTQSEGDAYSELEHAWDEGFGYYGAAQDFMLYTADEIASEGGRDDWQGAHDSNGDGSIDLRYERFFGASLNAAKRDRGSTSMTTMGSRAFLAFHEGRTIIASGDTSPDATARLGVARDAAVLAWEESIAATAIHYINDTVADMEAMSTDDYSFIDHAKHWSELKGFIFAPQFNPRSPLSAADFGMVHTLIRDRPVLVEADAAAAIADFITARGLLAAAYGFESADVENW